MRRGWWEMGVGVGRGGWEGKGGVSRLSVASTQPSTLSFFGPQSRRPAQGPARPRGHRAHLDPFMPVLFAYGALLSPEVLARRSVTLTAPPTPALAPGHAVAFAHRGGYATLVRADAPTTTAWRRDGGVTAACVSPAPARGALLALASDADVATLAAREGGYKLVDLRVRVVGGGGEEATALAFVSCAGLTLTAGPLPPRAAYAARLRIGATYLGLDDDAEWAAWLASLPTIGDGGALPGEYGDTAAGRVAAVAAAAALVAAGVAAAVAGAQ